MPFESVLSLFGAVSSLTSYRQGWIGFVGGVKQRMLRKLPTPPTNFGSPFFLIAEPKRSPIHYKAQCMYNMVAAFSEILISIN